MELVDPNLPVTNPLTNFLNRQQDSDYRKPPLKGEGWGSPQATEMVLNNLMFITAKVCDHGLFYLLLRNFFPPCGGLFIGLSTHLTKISANAHVWGDYD